jgi:hypothetical protein
MSLIVEPESSTNLDDPPESWSDLGMCRDVAGRAVPKKFFGTAESSRVASRFEAQIVAVDVSFDPTCGPVQAPLKPFIESPTMAGAELAAPRRQRRFLRRGVALLSPTHRRQEIRFVPQGLPSRISDTRPASSG